MVEAEVSSDSDSSSDEEVQQEVSCAATKQQRKTGKKMPAQKKQPYDSSKALCGYCLEVGHTMQDCHTVQDDIKKKRVYFDNNNKLCLSVS